MHWPAALIVGCQVTIYLSCGTTNYMRRCNVERTVLLPNILGFSRRLLRLIMWCSASRRNIHCRPLCSSLDSETQPASTSFRCCTWHRWTWWGRGGGRGARGLEVDTFSVFRTVVVWDLKWTFRSLRKKNDWLLDVVGKCGELRGCYWYLYTLRTDRFHRVIQHSTVAQQIIYTWYNTQSLLHLPHHVIR
jgi:hypothetical protein